MAETGEQLNLQTTQRVLAALKDAQSRIKQLEQAANEPVAVVGMACRFPGASNLDEFWKLLEVGADAIGPIPPDRWDVEKFYDAEKLPGHIYCKEGGFIGDVAGFDPGFFGIAPKEAAWIDPQHRLLLEVSWEALEDAGCNLNGLRGSSTGVFVGITTCDYSRLILESGTDAINGYLNTGTANNAAAGRIAYTFGLQGPAVAVDTACSSSLAALHMACQSLRSQECDAAVVAGVNLILSPDNFIAACQAGMLSPDGRCKTFDASADGYGRGEGCGAVILKRLSDAEAAQDRILAVIRGSAMNQDGASGGLTVPNGPAQSELIQRCLKNSGLTVDDVSYVEAHGTGTSLGDPIELRALGQVFKDKKDPVLVGSVKSNIGHLESASGMAGLIKVILSLAEEVIPAHLHFAKKNPHVDWRALNVVVAATALKWPAGVKRAGVSSFGGSGTNVHVIVENGNEALVSFKKRTAYLFKLSARSEWSLKERAGNILNWLRSHDQLSIQDVCHTCCSWSDFEFRMAMVVSSRKELLEELAIRLSDNSRIRMVEEASLEPKFTAREWNKVIQDLDRNDFSAVGTFLETLAPSGEIAFSEAGLLGALADDYLSGGNVDWSALQATHQGRRVRLPVYKFQRERYWVAGRPPAQALMPFNKRIHSAVNSDCEVYESEFDVDRPAYISQHKIDGKILFPAAIWVEMMLTCFKASSENFGFVLENFEVLAPVELLPSKREVIQLVIRRGAGVSKMDLHRRQTETPGWQSVARAEVKVSCELHSDEQATLAKAREHCPEVISVPEFYRELANSKVEYGPAFQVVHSLWRGEQEALAEISGTAQAGSFLTSVLLDGCFQVLATILGKHNLRGKVQSGFVKMQITSPLPSRFFSHAKIVSQSENQTIADFNVWDLNGNRLLNIQGLKIRSLNPGPNLFYQIEWKPISSVAGFTQWRNLISHVQQQSFSGAHDIPNGTVEHFERAAASFVAQAFLKLGWKYSPELFTLDAVAEWLRIDPKHRKFLQRLLEISTTSGVFEKHPEGWRQIAEFRPSLVTEFSGNSPEWKVFTRCGSRLAEVLRGEQEPLELLFPGPDSVGVAELYREAVGAKVINEQVRRAVQSLVSENKSGRPLQVLEIGGGTGGTTGMILDALPEGTTYLFTDISRALVSDACKRFSEFGIRGAVLNIEQSPVAQGIEQRFDLVIAANVIHATRSISETLHNIRSVLNLGGMLIFVEATTPRYWSDLIMGMTEGWWLFQDENIRQAHCLLAENAWNDLLAESGFEAPMISKPRLESVRLLSDFALFVTRCEERKADSSGSLWVLVGGSGMLRNNLEKELKRDAQKVVLMDDGSFQVSQTVLTQSLEKLSAETSELCLVFATDSENNRLDENSDSQVLNSSLNRSCGSVLKLIQAMVPLSKTPRLIFLTSRALAIINGETPNVALAPLGGLAKVVAREHPEWRSLHVDLESSEVNLTQLTEAMRQEKGPIAIRGGSILASVISPCEVPVGAPPKLDKSVAYLITGGLGGMGLSIAEWMVQSGARNLFLLGRKSPSDEVAAKLKTLEKLGARITVMLCDVSDRLEIRAVFKKIEDVGAPIKGIVHAAGVFEDRLLRDHQWELFEKVFEAKVFGSWNLHLLTESMELDFFIMTSSASALFGAPGMGNYVAASSFQDSLGMLRKSQRKPGLSINMGLWSETGMAVSVGAQRQEQYRNYGVRAMTPEVALNGLGKVLTCRGQMAMMDIDWEKFSGHFDKSHLELPVEAVPGTTANPRAHVRDYVEEELIKVLGLKPCSPIPGRRGFFDMGMDSLTSVELRNRLQSGLSITLPSTLTFKYPNLETLVAFLQQEISSRSKAQTPAPTRDETLPNVEEDLNQLMDDKLEALERLMMRGGNS